MTTHQEDLDELIMLAEYHMTALKGVAIVGGDQAMSEFKQWFRNKLIMWLEREQHSRAAEAVTLDEDGFPPRKLDKDWTPEHQHRELLMLLQETGAIDSVNATDMDWSATMVALTRWVREDHIRASRHRAEAKREAFKFLADQERDVVGNLAAAQEHIAALEIANASMLERLKAVKRALA